MHWLPRWVVGMTFVVCGMGKWTHAADEFPETDVDELQRATRQLDAEDFPIRRAARGLLATAGAHAVDPISQTAGTAGSHLAAECVSLLRHMAEDDRPDVSAAALAALHEIAQGDPSPAAGLAELALAPPLPLPDVDSRRFLPVRFGVNRVAAAPQQPGQVFVMPPVMLPGGPAGGVRRVRMQVINGRREMELEENGRRLHLLLTEQGLRATIADAAGGPGGVRTVTAADFNELRAKAPDLAAQIEPLLRGVMGGFPSRRGSP